MADNETTGTGKNVATDKVTYSGDADQNVQIVRIAQVTGTEGSKTVVDLPGDSTNGLDVDVTRMPGTVVEDAASAGGETAVLVAGVRRDGAASATTNTDGDYTLPALTSAGATITAGDHLYQTGTFTTTGAATALDLAGYNAVCVQFSTGTVSVSFEGSNDNATWIGIQLARQSSITTFSNSTASPGGTIWYGVVPTRYFRLNCTAYTSNVTYHVVAKTASANPAVQWTIASSTGGHDAAVSGTPFNISGVSSAAAPADVTADQEAVRLWALRNGALATQVTAAGALIGGDATNGLDVDVTRMPGTVVEDAASAGGETAVLVAGVRRDGAASATTNTDGDYTLPALTSAGAAITAGDHFASSGTITGTGATAALDLANYGWVAIQFISGNATVAWEVSNDNTNWDSHLLVRTDGTSGLATTAQNAAPSVYSGPVSARYFRLNCTSFTSNVSYAIVAKTAPVGSINSTRDVSGLAGHDSPISGNPVLMGGYASAAAPTSVQDGDAVRFWTLQNGAQAVNLTAAGALIGGDATNGLDVDVTRVSGQVTVGDGTNAISVVTTTADGASNTANSLRTTARLMGYNGTTWDMLRSDTTNGLDVDVTRLPGVAGDVAHDIGDSGNPIKIGGVAVSGSASPTSVAAGDRTRFIANQHGIPYVIGGHPNLITREYDFGTAAQTDVNLAAALVAADERIYVTRFEAMCDNANTVAVSVRAGFGTASVPAASATGVSGMIASHPGIAAGSGFVSGNGSGIIAVGGAGEEPRITTSAATSGNLHVVISYYLVDETP